MWNKISKLFGGEKVDTDMKNVMSSVISTTKPIDFLTETQWIEKFLKVAVTNYYGCLKDDAGRHIERLKQAVDFTLVDIAEPCPKFDSDSIEHKLWDTDDDAAGVKRYMLSFKPRKTTTIETRMILGRQDRLFLAMIAVFNNRCVPNKGFCTLVKDIAFLKLHPYDIYGVTIVNVKDPEKRTHYLIHDAGFNKNHELLYAWHSTHYGTLNTRTVIKDPIDVIYHLDDQERLMSTSVKHFIQINSKWESLFQSIGFSSSGLLGYKVSSAIKFDGTSHDRARVLKSIEDTDLEQLRFMQGKTHAEVCFVSRPYRYVRLSDPLSFNTVHYWNVPVSNIGYVPAYTVEKPLRQKVIDYTKLDEIKATDKRLAKEYLDELKRRALEPKDDTKPKPRTDTTASVQKKFIALSSDGFYYKDIWHTKSEKIVFDTNNGEPVLVETDAYYGLPLNDPSAASVRFEPEDILAIKAVPIGTELKR
jgi:hypothetical protein